jgi:hypothetical protein
MAGGKPGRGSGNEVPALEQPASITVDENAERRRVQCQARSREYLQLRPGHGQGPDEVSVRKGHHRALHSLEQVDEGTRPRIDLLRGLSSWTAVPEELPIRPGPVDLHRWQALVLAVVELAEKGRHSRVGEARQLCRAPGPLHVAGVDSGEVDTAQQLAQAPRLTLPLGEERQVGVRGVLTRSRPLGGAVAGEVEV